MNLFKKIFGEHKPVNTPDMQPSELTPEASELGHKFVDEYISKSGTNWSSSLKLASIEGWKVIKSKPLETQAQVCVWACSSGLFVNRYFKKMAHSTHNVILAELKLGSTLLRSKLPLLTSSLPS